MILEYIQWKLKISSKYINILIKENIKKNKEAKNKGKNDDSKKNKNNG